MKKVLKWIGIGLGGLVGLIVLAAAAFSVAGTARLNKTHQIPAEAVTIPTDAAALARGEHLVNVTCKSCHGAGLSGRSLTDDPAIGTIYAANITGLASTHTDADLVRAIRHGVDTDGRQLMIMPAESFVYFSKEDLGAVIAYLKTVPRTGDELSPPQLAVMGRILVGAGMFGDVFPAEYIDHNLPFPQMPAVGANEAYGRYLSHFCMACHGAALSGGRPADPQSPPAPDLSTGGGLSGWTEADFFKAMRTGVTPDGRHLNPAYMPWDSFGKFDDVELQALWMHLQTLSAAQAMTE